MKLRNGQRKTIDLAYAYFKNNKGNPVIEAPTGSGKSLIQAAFIEEVLTRFPDNRFLCLTHAKELIVQNFKQLNNYAPQIDAGIYSASLKRRDIEHSVIFASIQSIYKRAFELGKFDLIIIDECHLCPVKTSAGMYRKFLDDCLLANPHIKIIGLSATPYRLDNGLLIEGENRLFTDIITAKASGMDMKKLLDEGFLSPLTTEPVQTHLNTHGVGKRGGDFIPKQLAEAVDIDVITQSACEEMVQFGIDRKSWLVFASSVNHAWHIRAYLLSHSIECAVITGDTPAGERDQLIDDFQIKKIRCLINVNVLTTGFDAPGVDMLAFMRPTMSASLYIQMAGRGMRIAEGKENCLVLDFAGLIDIHGPVDDVNPPAHKKKGDGDAPQKECDECYMLIHASLRICPYCGFKFPFKDTPNINASASTSNILSVADTSEQVEVTEMDISIHKKTGKPDSIKITYYSGMQMAAREWVCLYHGGFAQTKAEQWWKDNVGSNVIYSDIIGALFALKDYYKMPNNLTIKPKGKYTQIISRSYENKMEKIT
jgi:DNA repair protein RadD